MLKIKPKLRFPEFDGEWEEKQLSAILEIGTGKSKVQSNESGKYNILGSTGIIGKSHTYDYEGDFILTARVGHYAGKLYKHAGKVNISDNTIYLFNFINKNFIYESLNAFKLEKLVFGSGQPLIKASDLKKLKIRVPVSKEQKKIGGFFSKLDRQIELEEQKLEKLEEQKKGYMQKIFSQELRFKDGNGNNYSEWIKTNLKFLVSYKNGKGYEKEVVQNGKYNIINLNSISTKGMLKDSGKYTDFEDITLKKNDLIMILSDVAKGNLIGKTAIIDQDDKYLLNQRVASLRIKDESTSNVLFIYYFINYFRQYFINMSTGMSQLNINKSTVEDFLIYLPYIEEQDKIGNFFSNLDKSIIKQLDKIELLKERKKGFLQKMFV